MLAELTDRRPIERDVEGSGQYGRMIATCFVDDENLNAALVTARIGNGRYPHCFSHGFAEVAALAHVLEPELAAAA